jgi:hypothetical protein
MENSTAQDPGLLRPLFSDGRHFLTLGTLGLLFSGSFAMFLAVTGQFLPHDIEFLGVTASQLCGLNACNIVHFMIHDRAAFGGVLVALSVLYFWLIHFPLRDGEPWAWWVLLLSNAAGFLSFLTYLEFGYLDTWHAVATLALLPCFSVGLIMTWRKLDRPRGIRCLRSSALHWPIRSSREFGSWLMLGAGFGLFTAGCTIMLVGMTIVFVPQDLEYMKTTPRILNAINPHLIPLIAHDRAGFGSGVLNIGLLVFAIAWCGGQSRSRWQALLVAGVVGLSDTTIRSIWRPRRRARLCFSRHYCSCPGGLPNHLSNPPRCRW